MLKELLYKEIVATQLPEQALLEQIISRAGSVARTKVICEVPWEQTAIPVYCLEIGSEAADAPVVGFVGGVHGVERIGSQVLLALLSGLVERYYWDDVLRHQLERVKLIFIPLLNPTGMLKQTRANYNNVDLMRNAPIDAIGKVPFLLGGQRFASWLPWYRGKRNQPMQIEAQAMMQVMDEALKRSPFCMTLDCHSGYGHVDRIWFPYAFTNEPFPQLAEVFALKSVFDASHPHHGYYQFEPQSLAYSTHGDLWDYLHMQHQQQRSNVFLPLTLEMGSWLWVKKNPKQLFSALGMFNPILPHRTERVLRRHVVFFDFLIRAAISWQTWLPKGDERERCAREAIRLWYAQSFALSIKN
ncbi:MAG TPA: DUF2817 domain-containing protein [Pseudomonadales bacterium]|nr:DUF2817 domain-containing protein [Pseudomonadales bacterium]